MHYLGLQIADTSESVRRDRLLHHVLRFLHKAHRICISFCLEIPNEKAVPVVASLAASISDSVSWWHFPCSLHLTHCSPMRRTMNLNFGRRSQSYQDPISSERSLDLVQSIDPIRNVHTHLCKAINKLALTVTEESIDSANHKTFPVLLFSGLPDIRLHFLDILLTEFLQKTLLALEVEITSKMQT
jgi:hypothetical protein